MVPLFCLHLHLFVKALESSNSSSSLDNWGAVRYKNRYAGEFRLLQQKEKNMTHSVKRICHYSFMPMQSMRVTVSHTDTLVGTFKGKQKGLVTLLFQHLHSVTQKQAVTSCISSQPSFWEVSVGVRSEGGGHQTKTLPVNFIWIDLIRWWFNFGVCGPPKSADFADFSLLWQAQQKMYEGEQIFLSRVSESEKKKVKCNTYEAHSSVTKACGVTEL